MRLTAFLHTLLLLPMCFLFGINAHVTGPPPCACDWLGCQGLPCPTDRPLAEHLLHMVSVPSILARLMAHTASAPHSRRADSFSGGEGQVVVVAMPHSSSASTLRTPEDNNCK